MVEKPEPSSEAANIEALKARRRRNLWLGLALAAFVVLVMAMTVIRLHTAAGISGRM